MKQWEFKHVVTFVKSTSGLAGSTTRPSCSWKISRRWRIRHQSQGNRDSKLCIEYMMYIHHMYCKYIYIYVYISKVTRRNLIPVWGQIFWQGKHRLASLLKTESYLGTSRDPDQRCFCQTHIGATNPVTAWHWKWRVEVNCAPQNVWFCLPA